jgi:hypothetical protein
MVENRTPFVSLFFSSFHYFFLIFYFSTPLLWDEFSPEEKEEWKAKDLLELIHKNFAAYGEDLTKSDGGKMKLEMYIKAAHNSDNCIGPDGKSSCISFFCF